MPAFAFRRALLAAGLLLSACHYEPQGLPRYDAGPRRDGADTMIGADQDLPAGDAAPKASADGGSADDTAPATDTAPAADTGATPDTGSPPDTSSPPDTGPPADTSLPPDMKPACPATCVPGDGCCPAGCNSNNDGDCAPKCGNGVVEKGETCEPVAECTRRQTACQSDQNTIRTGKGSAAACTFQCQESPRACGPADGACPGGCGRDPDCLPRPASCVHIEWCRKPTAPNQNLLICITNDDGRCTDGERMAECAREANTVCGAGHAAIVYSPPI
jgi:hypothetical protein